MVDKDVTSPAEILSQRILVLAPHMDDEILGCGGTILLHHDPTEIFCLYATDGARSPSPLLPWDGEVAPDIRDRRKQEACEVMEHAAVPRENLIFLGLPDGRLSRHRGELQDSLRKAIGRIKPTLILAPFRYDLHSDHTALSDAARSVLRNSSTKYRLLEYFIYFRWRLIAEEDIRTLIRPSELITIDTSAVNRKKSSLIRLYRSQTQLLHDWQEMPILTAGSIEQRCSQPEVFLVSDPGRPKLDVFSANKFRILLAHYIERFGKRRKDQALALIRRLRGSRPTHDA